MYSKGLYNGKRLEGLSKPVESVVSIFLRDFRIGQTNKHPFHPSTKATDGHDENISFDQGADLVGRDMMDWLRGRLSVFITKLVIMPQAEASALADTKFEFGQVEGQGDPIPIDEIFTPDSSRFWPAEEWQLGRAK